MHRPHLPETRGKRSLVIPTIGSVNGDEGRGSGKPQAYPRFEVPWYRSGDFDGGFYAKIFTLKALIDWATFFRHTYYDIPPTGIREMGNAFLSTPPSEKSTPIKVRPESTTKRGGQKFPRLHTYHGRVHIRRWVQELRVSFMRPRLRGAWSGKSSL